MAEFVCKIGTPGGQILEHPSVWLAGGFAVGLLLAVRR